MKKHQVINLLLNTETKEWGDGPGILLVRNEAGCTYAIKRYSNPLGVVACVYKTDRKRKVPYRLFFINKKELQ